LDRQQSWYNRDKASVPQFKYIGGIFTEDGKNKQYKIKQFKEAKVMFNNKNNYFFRITLL
jgi:hypothetical protein